MSETTSVEEIKQTPAYKALMGEWGQLDEDGISIAVSRQALEETIAMYEQALTQLKAQVERETRERDIQLLAESHAEIIKNCTEHPEGKTGCSRCSASKLCRLVLGDAMRKLSALSSSE